MSASVFNEVSRTFSEGSDSSLTMLGITPDRAISSAPCLETILTLRSFNVRCSHRSLRFTNHQSTNTGKRTRLNSGGNSLVQRRRQQDQRFLSQFCIFVIEGRAKSVQEILRRHASLLHDLQEYQLRLFSRGILAVACNEGGF